MIALRLACGLLPAFRIGSMEPRWDKFKLFILNVTVPFPRYGYSWVQLLWLSTRLGLFDTNNINGYGL
jgi:hypothetical protein